MAEIIGQAMAFRPTRVAQAQSKDLMDLDVIRYYQIRKEMLLRQYDYAYEMQDREGMADVKKAIRQYRNEVPFPEMTITSKDLKRSMRTRRRNRMLRERGYGPHRREIRLYRSLGRPDEAREGKWIDRVQ